MQYDDQCIIIKLTTHYDTRYIINRTYNAYIIIVCIIFYVSRDDTLIDQANNNINKLMKAIKS